MFGDIFTTDEQLLSGDVGGQIQSVWERQPRNCADKLTMPQLPRKKGFPIGLKNQGATCYLNSYFQLLFHTPELRELLLQLPLCKENSETPTQFVSKGKQNFLLGLQRLMSEMSLYDQKAVGTQYLQKAFGWEGQQHQQQQDVNEAMQIIFDTIQRALFGTEYHRSVRSLFRGTTTRYKTCMVCGQTSERPEQFNMLTLQVKNTKSVNEALAKLTVAESMDGDNAIHCDTCQAKQDMWLGTRLQELPGTLVLALNRFDFDYQKFDRVKLNTYFEFQLQLDLSGYLMPNSDPNYNKYELYGVIIHRGSAHGGHYLCFARDLMHESDWEKGLVEAKAQEARIKEGSEPKEKKDTQNQDKEYELTEPENKKLLQGWYQINDNVSTAISANKLTTKFEGSDSAYILFYRRKSLPLSQKKTRVPPYFAQPILEANKVMQKEREVYEFEKQHIVLKIEGEERKLKTSLPINELKDMFIPQGISLVLESSHNSLPYYPMEIRNHPDTVYKPEDTLFSLEVPHESVWKRYEINSAAYEDIKGGIGKNRLPMELVLIVDGEEPKRIVSYGDQNFIMLRLKIEKTINLAYENQIITLVTPYKQLVLTDKSQNDDMLLPKLGIIHGAQLQLKSQGNEDEDGMKEDKPKQSSLICFVIERDDVIGLKRFYYEKTKTLQGLLQYFLSMESLDDNKKRRFRNLNGNRLFYTDHYEITLEEIDFCEQMVRLRLERGQIPIKGDVSVKIKMQSQLYKKEGQEDVANVEKVFDPNTTIKDVKEWACLAYKLDPSLHKLYLTDWMTEPVRSLTREQLTVFEANFGRQETICLRDIYSPIGAELVHLQVFKTLGSPDTTVKEGIHVKIEQFKTVKDLKQLLINTLQLGDLSPSRLRLRQIKRDHMYGSIWRDVNKSVKAVTINSTKVVYQVLEQPEQLTEEQIVIVLKARNREKRTYEGVVQLVFEAGKNPNIEDLTEAIKAKIEIKDDLIITKYFHYNFEWIELSRKNIQILAKKKKNNQQKKKNQQQKGKKDEHQKKGQGSKHQGQNVHNEHKKKQDGATNQKDSSKAEKAGQNKEQKQAVQKKTHQAEKEPKDVKDTKPKKQKKGGKGGQQQKETLDQCQNLRKAPVLLKDGDMLGWGLASELQGDDLQTDDDLVWRAELKKQTAKFKGKEKGGFKLGVDF